MEMIREDMRYLAAGCAILDAAFLLIAACLGFFTLPLLLSVAVSSLVSLLNLALLIFHLKDSLLKSSRGARARAMGNYLLRLSMLGIVVYFGLTRDWLNAAGIIFPLFFPKIILSIRLMTQKGGNSNNGYNN